MSWDEYNLADLLVTRWPDALGVARDANGKLHGYPVPWRLWTRMPSRPKAPPIAIARRVDDLVGERCVAFGDVEAALLFVASEEGHCDQERLIAIARERQAAMGERRVRPLRWLDLCELAGVDPWQVAARSRRSLGVALAVLGLEAVRLEVRAADGRAETRVA